MNFVIGEKSAEAIKKNIASAYATDAQMDICGRNLVTGLPSEITVTGECVHEALAELFQSIVDSIKIILERTPPEISSDIYKSGLYLTGGSSRIQKEKKGTNNSSQIYLYFFQHSLCHSCSTKF